MIILIVAVVGLIGLALLGRRRTGQTGSLLQRPDAAKHISTADRTPPPQGFFPSSEMVRDPDTNTIQRVWYHPESGERWLEPLWIDSPRH